MDHFLSPCDTNYKSVVASCNMRDSILVVLGSVWIGLFKAYVDLSTNINLIKCVLVN